MSWKWSPYRLRAFLLDAQDASLCVSKIMLLAQCLISASGHEAVWFENCVMALLVFIVGDDCADASVPSSNNMVILMA